MSAVGRAGKEGFWSIRGAGEKKGGGGEDFGPLVAQKWLFPPIFSQVPRCHERPAQLRYSFPLLKDVEE